MSRRFVLRAGRVVERAPAPDVQHDRTGGDRQAEGEPVRQAAGRPPPATPAAPAAEDEPGGVGRSWSAPLMGMSEWPSARWTLRHPDQDGCGWTGQLAVTLAGGERRKVPMERGFVETDDAEVRRALERMGYVLWRTEVRQEGAERVSGAV